MKGHYKRWWSLMMISWLGLVLISCKPDPLSKSLRVGIISGPSTPLMQVAAQVAWQRYGLRIKIIEFSDYTLPNAALNEASLDANVFQHQAYLQEEIKNKHYSLAIIAKTFVYPLGVYSSRIKNLDQLRWRAGVAIPNDPSNEARALLLLEKAGLIKLGPKAGSLATPKSIVDNPKQLQLSELDAAQLPRVLIDVDIAVINNDYAILAHLCPNRDALVMEDRHSPYANLVVSRENNRDDPKLKQLVQALHSPEVIRATQDIYQGQAIPAW